MTDVHVVVPTGVEDPRRPSGGNVYDRRMLRELVALGWSVCKYVAPGSWPTPAPGDHAVLDKIVGGIPDGALVLVDGLVALAAPEVLVPQARRFRLVPLVHMQLSEAPTDGTEGETHEREHAVLSAATAVLTISGWTRRRLIDRHALQPERVHVAEPGVDPAELAPGTPAGGELLCVAAVAPHKGHDVLLNALTRLRGRTWRCTCVGSLDRDPEYVDRLQRHAWEDGISDRLRFTGPLTGAALDDAYAGADALVLASRGETYGMVVTEALSRGLPVIATAVGGLPETLGATIDMPGVLVPPDDPEALADALDAWLSDSDMRQRLRRAAEQRRSMLRGWPETGERIARVLTEVA